MEPYAPHEYLNHRFIGIQPGPASMAAVIWKAGPEGITWSGEQFVFSRSNLHQANRPRVLRRCDEVALSKGSIGVSLGPRRSVKLSYPQGPRSRRSQDGHRDPPITQLSGRREPPITTAHQSGRSYRWRSAVRAIAAAGRIQSYPRRLSHLNSPLEGPVLDLYGGGCHQRRGTYGAVPRKDSKKWLKHSPPRRTTISERAPTAPH